MCHEKVWFQIVEWIQVAQDSIQWLTLGNTALNLRVLQQVGSLTSITTISFSTTTQSPSKGTNKNRQRPSKLHIEAELQKTGQTSPLRVHFTQFAFHYTSN
jgi:hypothetical protein